MEKLKTAIVGATGVVGQQFALALHNHPWFDVTCLAASERSAGKSYTEALRDEKTRAMMWFGDDPVPGELQELTVQNAKNLELREIDVVFSAVEAPVSKILDPTYAKEKPVISTSAAFRYDDDIPILVPGGNSEHARLSEVQRRRRGWKGFITTQPNCTTTGLVITLKPLVDAYGVSRVILTSLQAVSGAGRSPGVIAFDVIDNVIPYIPREEDKVQAEALKILGHYKAERITPARTRISATCTRVNVTDGHTESVFASLGRESSVEEVKETFQRFQGDVSGLPSAPERMIVVSDDPFRPQPRLDRNACDGMATTVGRIRRDRVLDNGIKYVLVSHNTKMGAAKGAVLVAEYLVQVDII
jgi:aspartate-semialdehyde dehydrogenase